MELLDSQKNRLNEIISKVGLNREMFDFSEHKDKSWLQRTFGNGGLHFLMNVKGAPFYFKYYYYRPPGGAPFFDYIRYEPGESATMDEVDEGKLEFMCGEKGVFEHAVLIYFEKWLRYLKRELGAIGQK